jgi:hypothetical protein
MRRRTTQSQLRRRLCEAAVAICLFLAIADCILWGVTYRSNSPYQLPTAPPGPEVRIRVHSGGGRMVIVWFEFRRDRVLSTLYTTPFETLGRHLPWWARAGFYATSAPNQAYKFADGTTFPYGREGCIVFPHWLVVALVLIPPMVWLSRRRYRVQRDRVARGLCARCAYDLRFSPSRCPECGYPVAIVSNCANPHPAVSSPQNP